MIDSYNYHMSQFTDFNIGSLHLDSIPTIKLTGSGIITADKTTTWNNVMNMDIKEDVLNKSTNILEDADSDIKYPTVRAVKNYIDKQSQHTFFTIEGETTMTGQILWSCGNCPMIGRFGLFIPYGGKIHRITGLTHGNLGNINSLSINLLSYSLHGPAVIVRSILLEKHSTEEMLFLLDPPNTINILPHVNNGNILVLEDTVALDNANNPVSIPPNIRFRLTLEYEKIDPV